MKHDSIFDGAKFGDKFITESGEIAIYQELKKREDPYEPGSYYYDHRLFTQTKELMCADDGSTLNYVGEKNRIVDRCIDPTSITQPDVDANYISVMRLDGNGKKIAVVDYAIPPAGVPRVGDYIAMRASKVYGDNDRTHEWCDLYVQKVTFYTDGSVQILVSVC